MKEKKIDPKKTLKGKKRVHPITEKNPLGSGRNPAVIDWDLVKKLAAMQCTQIEICNALGISRATFSKTGKDEFGVTIGDKIDEWSEGGKCSLRRAQWLLAQKNAAMAIFLGKQYLGQKDDYKVKHEGNMTQEIVHYGDKAPKKWIEEKKDCGGIQIQTP